MHFESDRKFDSQKPEKIFINHQAFQAPTEIMRLRWLRIIEGSIPGCDLEDVNKLLDDPQAGRQFAAEHSQSSYKAMLAQDYAIGDYLKNTTSESQFTYIDRELLVSILQDLNRKKDYKPETLHLAGSIADRYLKTVLASGQPVPNLFALGATVTLLAAKLEQPISPSFNRMLALLPSEEQRRITKKHLIDLEEQILNALQFSLHFAGPMPFLERYQRLLGIDGEKGSHDYKQVGFTARQFCKYMQRFAQFLEYKPSQIAAAAIVLAVRLNVSPVGPSVGLKALRGD